jgi:hypothetical protein
MLLTCRDGFGVNVVFFKLSCGFSCLLKEFEFLFISVILIGVSFFFNGESSLLGKLEDDSRGEGVLITEWLNDVLVEIGYCLFVVFFVFSNFTAVVQHQWVLKAVFSICSRS